MRSVVLMLAAAALTLVPAAAQVKVGIVDFQKAVLGTAEIKKAQTELEARFKPRQDAMQKLQNELQQISAQLQSMQGKLTPQAESDLRVQGQRKERELQRLNDDLQADVDRDRNDILQKAGRQMREVVSKMAAEKAFDVVIDSANTLFFKDALDVTAEAIASYDKAYPAK